MASKSHHWNTCGPKHRFWRNFCLRICGQNQIALLKERNCKTKLFCRMKKTFLVKEGYVSFTVLILFVKAVPLSECWYFIRISKYLCVFFYLCWNIPNFKAVIDLTCPEIFCFLNSDQMNRQQEPCQTWNWIKIWLIWNHQISKHVTSVIVALLYIAWKPVIVFIIWGILSFLFNFVSWAVFLNEFYVFLYMLSQNWKYPSWLVFFCQVSISKSALNLVETIEISWYNKVNNNYVVWFCALKTTPAERNKGHFPF